MDVKAKYSERMKKTRLDAFEMKGMRKILWVSVDSKKKQMSGFSYQSWSRE